ncbi:MAG: hypothetical protein ACTSUV_06625 [Candidatus Ranarchaeia archaeon]
MTCKICNLPTKTELCKRHELALKNLKETHKRWQIAFTNIEWDDYLNQVFTNPKTGEWAKEVIQSLIEK